MAPEGKKVKVGMMECISLGISPVVKVKGKGRGRKFVQRRQGSSGADGADRVEVGRSRRPLAEQPVSKAQIRHDLAASE
jgi:hypothetical protein